MQSVVVVNVGEGADPFTKAGPARAKIRAFLGLLKSVVGGGLSYRTASRPTVEVGTAAAEGAVEVASGVGTITVTVNGVLAASKTWATSDIATCAALAAEVNASTNPLVTGHVRAAQEENRVMLYAKRKGVGGNAVTLACSGTGATATGARLTGGTSTTYTF